MGRRKPQQSKTAETVTDTEETSEGDSLLGLEGDDGGDDDEDIESASAGLASLAADGDDDIEVPATDIAPEEPAVDDGLTEKDRAEYRKAYQADKQSKALVLPSHAEKTPSGKPLYLLENISCKVGGRRTVLEAGKPLPNGVLSKAKIAVFLEAGKLGVSPPQRKKKRKSLLGLTD